MAEPLETATARLGRLRGVTWRWRPRAPRRARRTPAVGVIAQEVEAEFPDLVRTSRRGHKEVFYIGLIGPLIEAVRELDARVAALEDRLPPPAPDGSGSVDR